MTTLYDNWNGYLKPSGVTLSGEGTWNRKTLEYLYQNLKIYTKKIDNDHGKCLQRVFRGFHNYYKKNEFYSTIIISICEAPDKTRASIILSTQSKNISFVCCSSCTESCNQKRVIF